MPFHGRLGGVLILVAVLADSAVAAAQAGPVVLPGESKQFASRLKFAEDLAARKKWPDVIDEYQALLHAAGDALVPVDAPAEKLSPAVRSIQLRTLCHLRLAALPREALEIYRRRVDAQAGRWLEQGIINRDAAALRRVSDEAFCSGPAEKALEVLGDLAFEKGEFLQALHWWRLLACPPSEASPTELRYPSPQRDLAAVRARQVLALLFEGEQAAAAAELKAFRALNPQAVGWLAGRQGKYADILEDWLRRPPTSDAARSWLTFAGSASHNRILPAMPSPKLWVDGPTWRVRLDGGEPATEPAPASAALARRLTHHPVIVQGLAIVADARSVTGFDLFSGRLRFRHDLLPPGAAARLPAAPEGRPTLTAADGLLYVTAAEGQVGQNKGGSVLICLDPTAEKRERWRVGAGDKPATAAFEGAPLVQDGRVYVALTRRADGRQFTALCCHDAETGTLLWRREVCDAPGPQPGTTRPRLLTLAGTQVIWYTDAGAIVAVDVATGKPSWAVRYPSREAAPPGTELPWRDLAPAIHADNRLFVAPRDSDRLFCLDPDTGRTLWDRDRIDVVQVLGCTEGRLIFTTPRGIRAVGARSGADRGGWVQPAEGRLSSFGRGLLAGGWVLWPVQDQRLPLRALNVEDGTPERGPDLFEPTRLRRIEPGNMAFGDGCLVVAGPEELVGYVPQEHLPKERRKEEGKPGVSAPARLQALAEQARLWERDHQPAKAVEAWQTVLREDDLRRGLLREPGGGVRRGGQVAAARIGDLINGHNKDIYQAAEAEAVRLASSSTNASPAQTLLRLAERFPHAQVTKDRLAELARSPLPAGLQAEAADACRRLLAARWKDGGQDPDAVPALLVLARAYEAQRCWEAARATWRLLLERRGAIELKPGVTLRAAATERLSSPALRDAGPAAHPDLGLPLQRDWEAPAGRLLEMARGPLAAAAVRPVFCVRGGQLSCWDADKGTLHWTRPIPFAPSWAGSHADRVLVGGPAGLQCLRAADGQPTWEWPTEPENGFPGLDTLLSEFRLTGSYLYFLQGSRRLFALNLDSGYIRWSRWAPSALLFPEGGGAFQPHYQATDAWLLLQTTGGKRLILEGRSGKLMHEAESAEPWTQQPLVVDGDRFCLAEGPGRIVLLDAATGTEVWKHRPRLPTSLTGETPRLFGDGQVLFALLPRNWGYDLERLDPRTGGPLWPQTIRASRETFDIAAVASDQETVYVATRSTLIARSLADGTLRWQRFPIERAPRWRLLRTKDWLAAYPLEGDVALRWYGLLPGSVPLALPAPRDRSGPVLFYDPKDGQLVQRLNFTTPFADVAVQVFPGRLVVGAGGKAWGLAAPGPAD